LKLVEHSEPTPLTNSRSPSPTSTSSKMFRTVLVKSARSAASQAVRRAGPITRPASAIPTFQYAPSVFNAARCYSAAAGLAKPEVEGRIVDLLKNFDKVSAPELGVIPEKLLFVANQLFKVTDPSKVHSISKPRFFSAHQLTIYIAHRYLPLQQRSWFGQLGHG
jgi:hypothetical protein